MNVLITIALLDNGLSMGWASERIHLSVWTEKIEMEKYHTWIDLWNLMDFVDLWTQERDVTWAQERDVTWTYFWTWTDG